MVAAQETTLQKILEGENQYLVPLYQRPYQWGKAQWSVLWQDIVQLTEDIKEDPSSNHFIGSLVLAPYAGNVAGGLTRHLVVDGQQRLTTLTILLVAIHDHILSHDSAARRGAERIKNTFLTNQYLEDPYRTKLVPTQADRDAYSAVIDGVPGADGEGHIGSAYRWFRTALIDTELPVEEIEKATTSRLSLVSISTAESDNVHRIFESLNNTGLKLSQGDLLRNHIFMRLPEQGDHVYRTLWKPLQDLLTREELDTLFWLDLVQRKPTVKIGDTYQAQKKRFEAFGTEDEIAAEVRRLLELARLYRLIVRPEEEGSAPVRRRLQRLQAWASATVAPLVLHLLHLRAEGRFDDEALAGALLVIESLLVRRLLVGRPSMGLNRMFAQTVQDIGRSSDVDKELRDYFSRGQRHYSTDQDIRQAVANVPFYAVGRASQRKLLLTWIEELFESREPVDPAKLSIEHVLPQTLSSSWRQSLSAAVGEDAAIEWGPEQIQQRGQQLMEMIIEAWPGPNTAVKDSGPNNLWHRLDQMLTEIPAGRWTTYGDLAKALGTAAQPIGNRLRDAPVPNPHRVLTSSAKPSPDFRWGDEDRTDDPAEMLKQEGVLFDKSGRADSEQRLFAADLVRLVTDEEDLDDEALATDSSSDELF
ncbi:hypothetical protein BJF77_00425 [Kocuria sp. CNJ-770]|uniref:GmrSD restriction endonuclease domain-containing protein n=1 Tax=Kocuria sp. CNJ-770 TaxID=1904964 RepID=UPI00096075BD|nr:DUF262 domain-containing protein [Kocuria sp. CNJ-770]OLT10234.1 hypothetical protein BJF77_00425 [Kocuria sp. CNJ-770]